MPFVTALVPPEATEFVHAASLYTVYVAWPPAPVAKLDSVAESCTAVPASTGAVADNVVTIDDWISMTSISDVHGLVDPIVKPVPAGVELGLSPLYTACQ